VTLGLKTRYTRALERGEGRRIPSGISIGEKFVTNWLFV
jgi:hypothetical protein